VGARPDSCARGALCFLLWGAAAPGGPLVLARCSASSAEPRPPAGAFRAPGSAPASGAPTRPPETHQLRRVDAHAHDAYAHLGALLYPHAVEARHVGRVVGAGVLVVLGDELGWGWGWGGGRHLKRGVGMALIGGTGQHGADLSGLPLQPPPAPQAAPGPRGPRKGLTWLDTKICSGPASAKKPIWGGGGGRKGAGREPGHARGPAPWRPRSALQPPEQSSRHPSVPPTPFVNHAAAPC
jgi:hypothetical protein